MPVADSNISGRQALVRCRITNRPLAYSCLHSYCFIKYKLKQAGISSDERDSYRGLNVPRGSGIHVPWEKSLLKGVGRGHQRSHKLSFSLATEWRNARTTLPPNFPLFKHHTSLQNFNCYCCGRITLRAFSIYTAISFIHYFNSLKT